MLRWLVIVGVAAGCVSLPSRSVARQAGVSEASSTATGRMVFRAGLAPETGTEARQGPTGTLELVFRDEERFEYVLILRDASQALYHSAIVVRKGASESLAVLAAGVELRGAYVQLRGTGTFPVESQGETVLEELRRAPGAFEVFVKTSGGASPNLRGSIR
ncbi:MAG TPA: hypothetical protein VF981_14460 [Gemmatimonadaceae bacterium]